MRTYCAEDHEDEPETGKWLLFIGPADIDRVWATIRDAVHAGRLASHAKASTARPNPNSSSKKSVIVIYTMDGGKHATLVRDRLREMGFTHKMPWKSDVATGAGIYENRGFRNISKRYE